MELSLTPKGYYPDLFELGPEEIVVTSKAKPSFQTRSPYKNLSATYLLEGPKPMKKAELVSKIVLSSILPALFLYYSFEGGWGLALLALITATPIWFVLRGALRKPVTTLTFVEASDGDFAFYIPYYPEEEPAVQDFVREIQQRIGMHN